MSSAGPGRSPAGSLLASAGHSFRGSDGPLLSAARLLVPAAAPPSIDRWPTAGIDFSTPLRHRLSFSDNVSGRRKPAGVLLCEIWDYVGDAPPADDSAFRFLATETKSPHRNDFDASEARKTAYYKLRWKLKSGAYGPWSPVLSATIPA